MNVDHLNPQFGHFALVAAFILSCYGIIVGVLGAFRKDRRAVASAKIATHLTTLLGIVSVVSLAVLLLRHAYRLAYVW